MRRKGLVVKLVVASFVVSLLLSSAVVYAGVQRNWELAYEHDENGQRINGSLNKLGTAIKSGADIKVIITHPDSSVVSFFVQGVTINADKSIVGAWQMTYQEWGPGQLIHRITRLATDGTIKWLYDGAPPQEDIRPMKWFVNR